MFEQTFKNIDDILHKDAGCGSELDYVEQSSWILFLKYLDDLEKDRATAAELTGKTYTPIIDKNYQWTVWAMPKGKDGKLDHHKALTGDDLTDFVNNKLFPYLKKFKLSAESADTIEYKIGEVPRVTRGYEYIVYVPPENAESLTPFERTYQIDEDTTIEVELVGIIEPPEEDTL